MLKHNKIWVVAQQRVMIDFTQHFSNDNLRFSIKFSLNLPIKVCLEGGGGIILPDGYSVIGDISIENLYIF